MPIVRVVIFLRGNSLGDNYSGGSYPGDKCQENNFLWGNYPGGNCPRDSYTGRNCPEGDCSVGAII